MVTAAIAMMIAIPMVGCGQAAENGKTEQSSQSEPNVPEIPEYLKTDNVDWTGDFDAVDEGDTETADDYAAKITSGKMMEEKVELTGLQAKWEKDGVSYPAITVVGEDGKKSKPVPYEVVSIGRDGIYPEEGLSIKVQGIVRNSNEGFPEIIVPAWGLSVFNNAEDLEKDQNRDDPTEGEAVPVDGEDKPAEEPTGEGE
jgi:hypothetical protein